MAESSDQSEACVAAAQQAEDADEARGFLFLAQSYARRRTSPSGDAPEAAAPVREAKRARGRRKRPLLDRNDIDR